MNKTLFEEVIIFQNKTFKNATALSKTIHLAEEVKELLDDLRSSNPNRRLEFADCFLLLFGAASADGMSYEDICEAIDEKLKICYSRNWSPPDENGVVHHIPDLHTIKTK